MNEKPVLQHDGAAEPVKLRPAHSTQLDSSSTEARFASFRELNTYRHLKTSASAIPPPYRFR